MLSILRSIFKVNPTQEPLLAPHSLTTQVPDQWKIAGQVPEWSDTGEPVVAVTGDTPVINWLVLGLSFLAAISMHVPYWTISCTSCTGEGHSNGNIKQTVAIGQFPHT